MESIYMALADQTRLRLLNLMRGQEVCVCFFTDVLGDSQPKISRHLAYLRKAGLVKTRRDGKWVHYSIVEPNDEGGKRVLNEVLAWLDGQPEMRTEREMYRTICCTPELLVQIARTPIDFIEPGFEAVASEPDEVRRTSDHNELEEFLL